MQAWSISSSSSRRLELVEVRDPQPRPDEALVAMAAFSVNHGELRHVLTRPDGFVPGTDVAGVVVEGAADGSGPPPGARVCGFVEQGSWAARVAVASKNLAVLPAEVSMAHAAALPVAGLTALRALRLGGSLLGRRVLITGASAGVGRFAVQLAALGGGHVTGVTANRDRAAGIKDAGAAEVLIGFAPEGDSFDLILEAIGGDSLAAALRRIAQGGTIVHYGNASYSRVGDPTTFDSLAFFRNSPVRLLGYFIFEDLRASGGAGELAYLLGLVARQALRVQVELEDSWRTPWAAFDAVRERRIAGKAVLHVDGLA